MRLPWLIILSLLAAACGRTEPVRPRPDWGEVDTIIAVPIDVDGGVDKCTAVAVDQYTIPPSMRRPLDVLFVVDDSCSMANDQALLSSNMKTFFQEFQRNQVDFHVGVVTTDMKAMNRSGRLVAPFVSNLTPNVTTVFEQMVLVGTKGSGDERGLEAAHMALTPPLSTTTNMGFVRPNADFALVILSDEDDHSKQTVQSLADTVKGLKADGAAVTVGTILLSCGTTTNWRYSQYTRLFGERGITTRCNQTYSTTLRTIAGRALNKSCVVALREPLDPTRRIEVTMNGVPTMWRAAPPEDAYPKGSIELEPCVTSGGTVELTWSLCE